MRKLILLTISIGLCLSFGCAANPITGEEELMFDRDYHHDIKLGKEIAPLVEKELKGKIPDQALQDYVNGVGHKITRLSHNPDFDFNFAAVNDKSINAISLPGGRIFITKGLLLKLESESQLAGILAHETVHVVARDTENMMSKEAGMGALFVLAVSQARTQGEVAAADIAMRLVESKYSREDERTADIGGMDYMFRAGYNPNGMVETMQILQKEEEANNSCDFFSTHPSPENRIDYLRARIQSHYANSVAGTKVGKEDYQQNVLDRIKNLPDSPGR
ncbi:MAG: M48 family metallopeptidase [Sedimentisphaerales bacterium]|jgi:predicted Zn-dependent protease